MAIGSTAACAHVQESRPNHANDHQENLQFSIDESIRQQECRENPYHPKCHTNLTKP
jgi:hypothetical protein